MVCYLNKVASMKRLLWSGSLCILMTLVGCSGAQDDVLPDGDQTSSTLDTGGEVVALYDDAMPGEDSSDVAAGLSAGRRPSESSSPGSQATQRTRQATSTSLEIEPYTGPPILLEEPEVPPPARVVDRKVTVENFPDGTKHIERRLARYSDNRVQNDGPYREFFPSGQLFVEGTYREGMRVGQWTYWHTNGQKNRTVTYEGGLPEGNWDVFRPDGTLAERREFKRGLRDGTWIAFDETGEQARIEQQYRAGKPEGTRKEWYASGQLKSSFTFEGGQRHGPATEWAEDGTKRAEVVYRGGELDGRAIVWSPEGDETVRVYDNGKLVSGPAGDPAVGSDGS